MKIKPIFKFFLGLIFIKNILGCEKKAIFDHKIENRIVVQHLPKDIMVPSQVWDLIEGKLAYNALTGKLGPQDVTQFKYEENVFVGMNVRLIEKTNGILGGQSIEIVAPRAGLEIDLAQFIKLDKGTFILTFKPDVEIKLEQLKVYFVSRTVERKSFVGQTLGSGCNRYYEISDFYKNKILKEGIEVNVTEGRHASLLGGHFIFLASQEGAIRALTQLTFIDSEHPQYFCVAQN